MTAVTVVQVDPTALGGTASTVSTLAPTTAGNTIVVAVALFSSDGGANEIDMAASNPVTDASGNTYTPIGSAEIKHTGTTYYQHIYYYIATNIAASVGNLAITSSFQRANFSLVTAYELTPCGFDQATTNNGASTTSVTTGALTPPVNGALALETITYEGSDGGGIHTSAGWTTPRNAEAGGGTTYDAYFPQTTAASISFAKTGPSPSTGTWLVSGITLIPPAPVAVVGSAAAAAAATALVTAAGTLAPTIPVRESPPTRLAVDIETPDHRHYRWAGDERDPANVPSGLQFSSTMPGGFESLSCVLPRKTNTDYSDLVEYATITASGLGGTVAGQGRLSTQPRASGDQMTISPAALGWQTHLDDAQVRAIYLDMDQSKWTDMPGVRLDVVSGLSEVYNPSEQITGSPSLGPAVRTVITGDVSSVNISEAWYDSLGIPIGGLFHGWYRGTNVAFSGSHFQWVAGVSDDTVPTAGNSFTYSAAGPGGFLVSASTSTRRNAFVRLEWTDGSGLTVDETYPIDWTVLSVVGDHGLTLNGGDWNVAPTLLASDIVQHAVGTWCPEFTVNVDHGGYFISQMAFTDAPVPVSEIVRQCARFLLEDWAVWEGPTFWWTARGARARKWRARAGPTQLQETGPDATQLFNEVIVSYQDVDGTTLTAGPPGALVNVEDSSLRDSDPQNPVTAAGLTRRTLLSMGTGISADAIGIGALFLAEQKLAGHAGQATLTGVVQDTGGVFWPAWMVRAGDEISFTDAADTSSRRVVAASYDHDSRTCQISLDSPPDALAAILERLGAQIATVGFA